MYVTLQHVGKRFGKQWLYRGLNYTYTTEQLQVITGANGTGKTTLMLMISGYTSPTEGSIHYGYPYQTADIGFATPSMELPEELTLRELYHIHHVQLGKIQLYTPEQWFEYMQLSHKPDIPIKNFSSGMKQRVKLTLATWQKKLWLLDEPTTNLDQNGVAWYKNIIHNKPNDALVIVSTNSTQDYDFIAHSIHALSNHH